MRRETLEKLYWGMTKTEECESKDFGEYYAHLRQVFLRGIAEDRQEGRIPVLDPGLLAEWTRQMQRITMRTLIFEMELCEECGELSGATEEEKYRSYAAGYLQNPDYLRDIYGEYPLMYEAMMRGIADGIRNICDLLGRFDRDREEINRRFYPDAPCREIRSIGGGRSDSHRGGKRVYILELDNGEKLVYKPRSLAVDENYRRLAQWVMEGASLPYWWNLVWDRQAYGWCQWVSSAPCASREELARYYQRNGILLCISYLLGSQDIHYENLIAHGEYPVIIDLEMVIGSRGTGNGAGHEELTKTERVYRESVLPTGLLPMYAWNEAGEGVNVGAINGKGGQLLPVTMPVVVAAGTVHMHVEYRQPVMGEGKNLATLNGRFVEPYEFLKEIQDGFEKAYTFILAHRDRAQELLERFTGSPVRYLLRDTQQYVMFLMASCHPDYLTGEDTRRIVWSRLEKRDIPDAGLRRWVQEQEVKELSRDDIPYFYYKINERTLYSGAGESWEGYFDEPVITVIQRRLGRMGQRDLERQEQLIRAALLMGTKKKRMAAPVCGNAGKGAGTAAAERIGAHLLQEAIWSDDRTELGWISMVMAGYRERSYLIRPMNLYLYDGLAGMAVFFTELAKSTGRDPYCEAAAVLVRYLFAYTDRRQEKRGGDPCTTGAYSGEGSVAFAYLLLYSIDRSPIFLRYLRKQCRITAEGFSRDTEYDVLGGNAGTVLVFLNAYRLTGESWYLDQAREAGDCLIQAATEYEWGWGWINKQCGTALTGFAHGASGVMLALARLGYETQEERYWEAARQAYRYEEHYYQPDRMDWRDLRFPEQDIHDGGHGQEMAWCHGWGGILLARKLAAKYVPTDFRAELEQSLERFPQKVASIGDTDPWCLCHGRSGQAAILSALGEQERADLWQRQIAGSCLAAERIEDLLCMQERENFGLMGGMAGIGYLCLCGAEKASRILSVLS